MRERIRTLTTLTDAERLIGEWTESYEEQPSPAALRYAAHRLIEHVGGYGADASREATDTFDLDSALEAGERSAAAAALGRTRSEAKARAARANGAKGGRPRKPRGDDA